MVDEEEQLLQIKISSNYRVILAGYVSSLLFSLHNFFSFCWVSQ